MIVNDPNARRAYLEWEIVDVESSERLGASGRDVQLVIPDGSIGSGGSDLFIPLEQSHVGRRLIFRLQVFDAERKERIDSGETDRSQAILVSR